MSYYDESGTSLDRELKLVGNQSGFHSFEGINDVRECMQFFNAVWNKFHLTCNLQCCELKTNENVGRM